MSKNKSRMRGGGGSRSPQNFPNHSLCQGDNLDFLRSINSNSIDLIATDPPFNSGRDYFANPNSIAKGAYFPDKWAWSAKMRDQHLEELEEIDQKAYHYIGGVWQTLGDGALTSFLLFMSLRLVEMKRVLKPTGTIYLHCDHHASHYLKQLMDIIFGVDNFLGDIIWNKSNGVKSKSHWGNENDNILCYAIKKNKHTFNSKEPVCRVSFSDISLSMHFKHKDENGRLYRKRTVNGKDYIYYADDGRFIGNIWNDITSMQANTPLHGERTGYPTQKPVALYERIVKASSNEGDFVLDPFCGCATTLVAAENLGRQWIGIDIHPQTRVIVANRIADACNLSSPDGSVKAQLNHLDMERDLSIYIFTKGKFPARSN